MELKDFNDFVQILLASGFSIGSGNDEGNWRTVPPVSPIIWHTGDPETDPWER